MSKNYIWCHDTPFQCCSSCHSDWDDGFGEPSEHEISQRTIFMGCCDSRVPNRSLAANILWGKRTDALRVADRSEK